MIEKEFETYKHLAPKVVDQLLRTSYSYMYRYREDLVQEGYVKLTELLQNPEELTKASFSTYAWIAIRNHVIHVIEEYWKNDSINYIGAESDLTERFVDNNSLSAEKRIELKRYLESLSTGQRIIYEDWLVDREYTSITAKKLKRRLSYVVAMRKILLNKLKLILNGKYN